MFLEDSHYMKYYGVQGIENTKLDFVHFKQARDDYIKRLNSIYMTNVGNDGITFIPGLASFVHEQVIEVGSRLLTAKHILIASGSAP